MYDIQVILTIPYVWNRIYWIVPVRFHVLLYQDLINWSIDWLIDWLLACLIDWLYFSISLRWRHHYCLWRAARPLLGTNGLWAVRGLCRVTPAVTRDPVQIYLNFIKSQGYWGPILAKITTGAQLFANRTASNVSWCSILYIFVTKYFFA